MSYPYDVFITYSGNNQWNQLPLLGFLNVSGDKLLLGGVNGSKFEFIVKDGTGYFSNAMFGNLNRNILSGLYALVGGDGNSGIGLRSVCLGGLSNLSSGIDSVTLGGDLNRNYGSLSAIIGGSGNYINPNSDCALVFGGIQNTGSGFAYAIIGGKANINQGGTYSVILGGENNILSGSPDRCGIVGGFGNRLFNAMRCFIGGGQNNTITGNRSATIGGSTNMILGDDSFAFGVLNTVSGDKAFGIGTATLIHPDHMGAQVYGDSLQGLNRKKSVGRDTIAFYFTGGFYIKSGICFPEAGFKFPITGDIITSISTGTSGEVRIKDDYLYVWTGNNTPGEIRIYSIGHSPQPDATDGGGAATISYGFSNLSGEAYACQSQDDGFAEVVFPGDVVTPIQPTIVLPTPGVYFVDHLLFTQRGSVVNTINFKLFNTTTAQDVPNSTYSVYGGGNLTDFSGWGSHFLRTKVVTTTNNNTISLYAHYLGGATDESVFVVPTGSNISYIKVA